MQKQFLKDGVWYFANGGRTMEEESQDHHNLNGVKAEEWGAQSSWCKELSGVKVVTVFDIWAGADAEAILERWCLILCQRWSNDGGRKPRSPQSFDGVKTEEWGAQSSWCKELSGVKVVTTVFDIRAGAEAISENGVWYCVNGGRTMEEESQDHHNLDGVKAEEWDVQSSWCKELSGVKVVTTVFNSWADAEAISENGVWYCANDGWTTEEGRRSWVEEKLKYRPLKNN